MLLAAENPVDLGNTRCSFKASLLLRPHPKALVLSVVSDYAMLMLACRDTVPVKSAAREVQSGSAGMECHETRGLSYGNKAMSLKTVDTLG